MSEKEQNPMSAPPAEDDSRATAQPGNDGESVVDGGEVEALPLADLSRDELENQLEVARAEIGRLQDQSLRRQAELINYRRRAQRELADSAAAGQSRLLEQLVPILDDFERAVDHEAEDARAYHEGMQLILRRLQKTLEQIGVERIEPEGEPFDPRIHEAIARHETDEAPDGQVLEVYQAGYKLGDRLIRPATVVVAFGGPARTSSDTASSPGEASDG